jgi:hypothetical protein
MTSSQTDAPLLTLAKLLREVAGRLVALEQRFDRLEQIVIDNGDDLSALYDQACGLDDPDVRFIGCDDECALELGPTIESVEVSYSNGKRIVVL